jgi:hypothetical protein
VKGGTPAVLPIATVSDAYVAGLVTGATATHDAVAALAGGGGISLTDNGDGTFALAGTSVTNNGDGTYTIA